MPHRRHLILLFASFFICCIALTSAACRKKDQPAETGTVGNATDRNPATGTNGTGEPVSPATGSTAAAQQLGTVAPSAANSGTAPVALTGTEEVHAQRTDTTSTLQGPGGTTTASVATPTDTTATIKTPAGTTTAAVTKKH
jgi:hypothetical protein